MIEFILESISYKLFYIALKITPRKDWYWKSLAYSYKYYLQGRILQRGEKS